MNEAAPEDLVTDGYYATFHPRGSFTFDEIVGRIDDALRYCQSENIRKLLVNILDVTGVPPPTLVQRFYFATTWANTAGGRVALAMVAPNEMIDEEKIGVTMARNRGLKTEVFTTELEAHRWLTKRS